MEKPQQSFRIIGYVAGVNLLILILYSVGMVFGQEQRPQGFGIAFDMFVSIIFHTIINFLIMIGAYFAGNKRFANATAISILVVLVVGGSICGFVN